jgi:hypothetical protein
VLEWPEWVREAAEAEAATYVADTLARLEMLLAAANVNVHELDYNAATGDVRFWGGSANASDYDGKITLALRAALLDAATQQKERAAGMGEQARQSKAALSEVEWRAADRRERDEWIEQTLTQTASPSNLDTPKRQDD